MTDKYELIMSHSDDELDAVIATYNSYPDAKAGLEYHTNHWADYRTIKRIVKVRNCHVLIGKGFGVAYRIQRVSDNYDESVSFVGV